MRVFNGYDEREALGTWVWQHSVMKRSSQPVEFTSLSGDFALKGTNAFTYARFEVAARCNFRGPPVIFADGADMVCFADVRGMLEHYELGKAVQVVKRPDYTPRPKKYIGTLMQADNKAYPKKNWSSVMLISPSHYGWRRIDWARPEPAYWQEFGWLKDSEIGEIPECWNRLVDEGDEIETAKILHFTLGVPAMWHHRKSPGAELWWREAREALNVCDPFWSGKINLLIAAYGVGDAGRLGASGGIVG